MDCLYPVYTVEKAAVPTVSGTQCADVGNDFGGFSGGSFAMTQTARADITASRPSSTHPAPQESRLGWAAPGRTATLEVALCAEQSVGRFVGCVACRRRSTSDETLVVVRRPGLEVLDAFAPLRWSSSLGPAALRLDGEQRHLFRRGQLGNDLASSPDTSVKRPVVRWDSMKLLDTDRSLGGGGPARSG